MKMIGGKVEGNINASTMQLNGSIKKGGIVLKGNIRTGSGGAKLPIDYEDDKQLINRPSINDVVLIGNKTGEDLKLQDEMTEITEQEIDNIIFGG